MTMRLQLRRAGADLVSFGCSQANEALRSLHVLNDVKHHPLHISWALRTRTRMTPELKDETEKYAFWYLDRPLVFREIWSQADVWSWADELSALREAPIEHFTEQLIHGALMHKTLGRRIPLGIFLQSADLQGQALAQIQARHPASLPVMRELIADPEHCRERFAEFLSSYWQACIAPDWPSMETHLRDDIARRGRAMSRRGLPRMLEELSPHVRVDQRTDDVVIRPPGLPKDADQIDLTLTEHDQILLMPSHFVWPELTAVAQKDLRDGREQLTVLIVYALAEMQQEGQAPIPPGDLLKLLRSAGDTTRLQVLQLLAQRPRSTREIAGLIGLTEAAISKHLKLLQDAGWVKPERQSYYVYYQLVRESLTDLSHGLEQMLG
jgi:DNA-binding transcriptional ArsR family regulator